MNCDDVFAILTRGPFPSGDQDDAAVERHLQECAECHRLAEALRPNDTALRDATDEQEISALPGYWGDLVGVPTRSITDTADFSRPKQMPRFRSRRQLAKNLNVGQFAAAVALGIVLAAALRTLVTVTPRSPTVQATLLSNRRERSSTVEWLKDMSPACHGDDASDSVGVSPLAFVPHHQIDGLQVRCCTSCHAAGRELKVSEAAKSIIGTACIDCHGTDKTTYWLERNSLGTRAN